MAINTPTGATPIPEGGSGGNRPVRLFLCGDVMTGRGIDQVLPYPSAPELYETYVRSATEYVRLAEKKTGILPRQVDFRYVWGAALDELERMRPDARIINLETSITASNDAWPGKGIHYRMHPRNIPCLLAPRIDCCALANNHVLDWGRNGLVDTLDTLGRAGLRPAGAGRSSAEAAAPAIIDCASGARVLVFALATEDSGVPADWAATPTRPGIAILADLSPRTADMIAARVRSHKRQGDVAVVSIHWGGNWGFDIPRAQRAFARRLIDMGGADVVHGHSSHHVKGIEICAGKPIIYGCGDFLNDYEGIEGQQRYRSDLSLMYFPVIGNLGGGLRQFLLVPMQTRHFRVNRPGPEDAQWMFETLKRECARLGTAVEQLADGRLSVCN